ncbi:metallophosphoesterase family protein [Mucilaginibacter angelicae]|uniref:Metallophosphoesterase family protein n=1 Tax=Mucilaginibacter angelicae TaxID=869718 RepID=A0ABV6L630_9SPHI
MNKSFFIGSKKTTTIIKKLNTSQLLLLAFFSFSYHSTFAQTKSAVINMVFTSDAHYGINRAKFRGDTNVTGHKVNAAMINQINTLPGLKLPNDGGINAARNVGGIDFLVEGGDITNRMEPPVQSSALSWDQFKADYMQALKLKGHNGMPVKLLMVPGNHDISNAIGFYKPMIPMKDPSAMVNIYNLMLHPQKPLTNQTYDYHQDKINYSMNIKGIHLQFITLWPDSAERIWMAKDLDTVAAKTPVIIFTHDQPTSESKHFTNPVPPYRITATLKFENLTEERYKDSLGIAGGTSTDLEQRGWAAFLKAHANIKAYFHGNSNWNEFYNYQGPDHDVNLPIFRVDSPMKGKYSAKDETKLSFLLISIDTDKQTLTARECLWNTEPLNTGQKPIFGSAATISLKVN